MAGSPFGDGHAAVRTVAAIEHLLGLGEAPTEFHPARTRARPLAPCTPGGHEDELQLQLPSSQRRVPAPRAARRMTRDGKPGALRSINGVDHPA
jgi:hypothetical protein